MSALNSFRNSLQSPEHRFEDTLKFLDEHYSFTPTAFSNGPVCNAAGENSGSCKVLAMSQLEGFSQEEALRAFGEHYRAVAEDPDGSSHANIRALISNGLAGVTFEQPPLQRKSD